MRLRPGDGITVTCNADGCDFERSSASDSAKSSWHEHSFETDHKRATVSFDRGDGTVPLRQDSALVDFMVWQRTKATAS